MLISYSSLGLGAADNSAVVNDSSTQKCAFLSMRDNLAAFDHQQPNAPRRLEACYQLYGGVPCSLCRRDQSSSVLPAFSHQASHYCQELTIYIPASLIL